MAREERQMHDRLNLLKVALKQGNYELAAHTLVYGLVKASISRNSDGNSGEERQEQSDSESCIESRAR